MDVIVTGSSGLIGSALVDALTDAGHRPIKLVRRPAVGADEIHWDPASGEIDGVSIEGADAVVHLAGAGIGDKRWNDAYKKVLVESRTRGTSLLASTLAGLQTAPNVLLSGSAIGYYGDRGTEVLTEASEPADTFLADLTVRWEAAAQSAVDAGIRTAFLRTGIVQTPKGGALKKMLPLFKVGLGGKFGDGSQVMSWISLTDQVGAIMHLLDADVAGPVNLTAPTPVTNATFAATLGAVLGRPAFIPVPAFGPRLALGTEMANALLFESAHVEPAALLASGYTFHHPTLEQALRAELGR